MVLYAVTIGRQDYNVSYQLCSVVFYIVKEIIFIWSLLILPIRRFSNQLEHLFVGFFQWILNCSLDFQS